MAAEEMRWSQLPDIPDKLGLASPVAGAAGGALIVAGGANFPNGYPWEGGKKVWHRNIYALTPGASAWRTVGELPHPLAYAACITTDAGILCAGGSDAERHYAECFLLKFDGKDAQIRPLPPLPMPLANAAAIELGGVAYVIGGCPAPGENSASGDVFSLSLSHPADGWKKCPPIPGKPRFFPFTGAAHGSLFVFGGIALEADTTGKTRRRYLSDSFCWKPGGDWQRLPDMPSPLAAGPTPAPFVHGAFLLPGGDDGSKLGFEPVQEHPGFSRKMLAFDPANSTWKSAAEMPFARATASCVPWAGGFAIPSGEMRPGVRSPQVHFFRPDKHGNP
jgi:N-acetylneuraminic acid mutarotase